MKTTFIPTRGHNYHVVHETKTGGARKSCYTICGEYFESGERSTRRATCPNCIKLDNPLGLDLEMREFLRTLVQMPIWRDAPRNRTFHALVERDYITSKSSEQVQFTRRGEVLAEDWKLGPVPMQDTDGIMHVRAPLDMYPRCAKNGRLDGVDKMSLNLYEKLRKIEDTLVISCLTCLGK